jgi:SAM-dependent methyltransferase
MIQQDYNNRDVDFSRIHAIHPIHFELFLDNIFSQKHKKIIDIGGGYGGVLLACLDRSSSLEIDQYTIIEPYAQQISKGKELLNGLAGFEAIRNNFKYIKSSFLDYAPLSDTFDQAILKMALHEFPKNQQIQVLEKCFSLLKPGGYLNLWMPHLTETTHPFFTEVIRQKDLAAGFQELASQRYFSSDTTLRNNAAAVGWKVDKPTFIFEYILDTRLRLDSEFKNQPQAYQRWLERIIKTYEQSSDKLKDEVPIMKVPNGVAIRFQRAIYKLHKV